jgi:diketogulonate reductase-like aldo/keto reductase
MAESMRLNTGSHIPKIGFGTWEVAPRDVTNAVSTALKVGYRLIDTAQMYNNEEGVGTAIRESGIDRSDIFLTTKLHPNSYGHRNALEAFEASLSRLGLEYVDLYLMHWPAPFGSNDAAVNSRLRKETWHAFEEIHKSGRAKNIGVSNFVVHHLEELMQYANVLPAVDQIELHPFVYEEQRPIVESCQKYEIIIEAYSPLSRGGHINDPVVGKIAEAHGKTNAQVLIRWGLQHDAVPLPRSINLDHITENFDVFDFELTAAEMRTLNGLTDSSARVAPDPHHMK